MGPTWVLSAPDGPHVGPMYLAIGMVLSFPVSTVYLMLDYYDDKLGDDDFKNVFKNREVRLFT